MRFLPVPPALLRGWLAGACLLLVQAGAAGAAQLVVRVEGVDEPLKAAVLAAVEAAQYGKRDVTEAQARRLLQRADAQAARALEPYGYFSAQARGTLDQSGPAYTLVLHVSAGEPTRVARLDIRIDADARDQREVRDALTAFAPAQGQVLDQAAYERSKAALQAALAASGYLDAQLSTHRIEVTRATRSAAIELEWQAGPRYRFGPTRFEGAQFPTALLDRYIPWREGDFYTQQQLLAFQQRLIDSDYYAMVQVDPAGDEASAGSVPIHVQLAPAKRTLYTGGVFVGTDTGPGVRGGLQRRWVNSRGHKLAADVLAALWLKTAATQYTIPLAGPDNHTWSFGVKYRDEDTDTASSRTFALAATDSRLWHGWTRTLGLKFLTGDFKVANLAGNTTLLYPEVVLARKHADEPLFVRDGWSLTLAARAAPEQLLSSTRFVQLGADAKWIHALGERSRFIARGSLGTTWTADFNRLPPELRFFAGGDRSIRGYPYQSIGPPLPAALVPLAQAQCAARPGRSCQDLVIGGKHLAVLSAEYEYYFKPNWGIAGFVDSGDAFTDAGSYRQKTGVGLGLRWRSPVGMVRVDLGVPVRDREHHGVQLHIVIGPDL
ncbi:outer membrane protein assembly factor [Gammaproteobacteria bacterium PRO6]|nr:outer membrane protein assembly factor [Gammaproteobacteria bacterium PRO6]